MKLVCLLCLTLGLIAGMARAQTGSPDAERQSIVINQTVEPFFPPGLLTQGFSDGLVRVQIAVAPTGELADMLVLEYTHPQFAEEAVKAIRQWTFKPARIRGQPVLAHTEIIVSYASTGTVVSHDNNSYMESYVNRLSKNKEARRLSTLKELDRIPTPLHAVAPVYSKELARQGIQGTATVEFFIDETGTVRMPGIASTDVTVDGQRNGISPVSSPQNADHEVLGELALAAIRQWKFEPPTRQGEPVLVKARQTFRFAPEKR